MLGKEKIETQMKWRSYEWKVLMVTEKILYLMGGIDTFKYQNHLVSPEMTAVHRFKCSAKRNA